MYRRSRRADQWTVMTPNRRGGDRFKRRETIGRNTVCSSRVRRRASEVSTETRLRTPPRQPSADRPD